MYIKEIFNWDANKTQEYPGEWGHLISSKGHHCPIDIKGNGKTVSINLSYPLTAALYNYIQLQNGMESEDKVAAGSSANKGTEKIYVEYTKNGKEYTQLVEYDPANGLVKGLMYNKNTLSFHPYMFDGKDIDIKSGLVPQREAIFMALFASGILDQLSLGKYIARLADDIKKGVANDDTMKDLAYVNGIVYYAIKDETIKMDIYGKVGSGNAAQLKTLKEKQIQDGAIGPSRGKNFFGDFEVFSTSAKGIAKSNPTKVDFSKYNDYPFVKPLGAFTKDELSLIPKEDKSFTPTTEFVRVLDYFYDTKDDGIDAIKQIMLTGGPGGGKSTIGVQVGHYLGGGRPTLTFTCGSNYTSDELKGMLLPCPRGSVEGLTEQEQTLLDAIRNSTMDDIFEKSCQALDLPTTFQCIADPDAAYEKITGFPRPEGVEEDAVAEMLFSRVQQAQKEVTEKAMALSNEGKNEIQYKYMPSNIVVAMTKGYILVLDELTNMRDPAALSDLHEALDIASSTRRISTPVGDFFVHPDFRCITTANIGLEGNKRMNQATLNRLAQVLVPINDPNKEVLYARVKNRTKIEDNKVINQCIDVYIALRDHAQEMRLPGVISPRDLFTFVRAINRGMDELLATEECLIYKLTQDSLSEDNEELRELISGFELYN